MHQYHKTGGVLSIVSGGIGILTGLSLFLWILFFGLLFENDINAPDSHSFLVVMALFYGLIGLFYILLGVLGIVGGVFALKQKHWGLALAGAIASTLTFYICGIIALIFVVLAKNEFNRTPAALTGWPVTYQPQPPSPLSPPPPVLPPQV